MLRLSLRGPWVHMPGDPIRIRRGSATGEQVPQLSKRYAHRRYILAKVLDQFIQEEGGAEVIPESLWHRRLGRVWYSAGRQLHALGRHDEAAECFRLAAERNPRHLRARLRRLAHSLPG
jgi:tetratricopeptide (TPR) repeat protein